MSEINLVKDLRAATGMSQMSLAVALKCSISTITRYEKGENVDLADLAAMVTMAREANRGDLALQFKTVILQRVGDAVAAIIREGDIDGSPREETTPERKGNKRKIPA